MKILRTQPAADENPKSEGRRPKEIRRPKSEASAVGKLDSDDGLWREEEGSNVCELKEDAQESKIPVPALGERTARFGEAIIRFAKKIPASPVNERLISQLVGAGTSVGANYCEADDSISGKGF